MNDARCVRSVPGELIWSKIERVGTNILCVGQRAPIPYPYTIKLRDIRRKELEGYQICVISIVEASVRLNVACRYLRFEFALEYSSANSSHD